MNKELENPLRISGRIGDAPHYALMIGMLSGGSAGMLGHAPRVAFYASLMFDQLILKQNLSRRLAKEVEEVNIEPDDLILGALLHDIGKTLIPAFVLTEHMSESPERKLLLHTHPEIGYRLYIQSLPLGISPNATVCNSILYHHERFDGNGYPYGLKGSDIPLSARIISIANYFDEFTSSRSYRHKLSWHRAIESEILLMGQQHLDKDLCDLFACCLRKAFVIDENNQNPLLAQIDSFLTRTHIFLKYNIRKEFFPL